MQEIGRGTCIWCDIWIGKDDSYCNDCQKDLDELEIVLKQRRIGLID